MSLFPNLDLESPNGWRSRMRHFYCHAGKITMSLGQVQTPLSPILIYVIDTGTPGPLDSVLLHASGAVPLILSLRR